MNRFFLISFVATFAFVVASCSHLKRTDDVCEQMDDIAFMKYCYDNFDVNKDGKVSMPEAAAVKELSVEKMNLNSLKGIEYFVNLIELNCERNSLSSLDVSKNTQLVKLNCGHNQLKQLDVSKNKELTDLECYFNQLTSLDCSNNTQLTLLICLKNQLKSLNISNNELLAMLYCDNNQLERLDLSHNVQLSTLSCRDNINLTALDISTNTQLRSINCINCPITTLDVSNCEETPSLMCNGITIYLKEGASLDPLSYFTCEDCTFEYKRWFFGL